MKDEESLISNKHKEEAERRAEERVCARIQQTTCICLCFSVFAALIGFYFWYSYFPVETTCTIKKSLVHEFIPFATPYDGPLVEIEIGLMPQDGYWVEQKCNDFGCVEGLAYIDVYQQRRNNNTDSAISFYAEGSEHPCEITKLLMEIRITSFRGGYHSQLKAAGAGPAYVFSWVFFLGFLSFPALAIWVCVSHGIEESNRQNNNNH